jgi:hypothetical protein
LYRIAATKWSDGGANRDRGLALLALHGKVTTMSADAPAPSIPVPPSADAPARAPVEPLSAAEVTVALRQPVRLFDLVLAVPEGVAANVERHEALDRLIWLFLLASVAFSIPYGLVHGFLSWWRVTALYLGSTLICLPSLHVFSSYLGLRVSLPQIVVLALTIPAVASVFTFGFAPILGFLRATMDDTGGQVSWSTVSAFLLVIALVAGVAQLWRCLFSPKQLASRFPFLAVLLVWHGVFLHVLLRMGHVLELI